MKLPWQWIPVAFTLGVLITWKAGSLHDWWFPEDGLMRDIARMERSIAATRYDLADWRQQAETQDAEDAQEARQFAFDIEGELRVELASLEEARAALRRVSY